MKQPLADFLKDAIAVNDRALQMKDDATWQSAMFTFVRIAKSHPKLQTLSAVDAALVIEKALMGTSVDMDQVFDSPDALAELVATWDRVMAIDGDPLSNAWATACRRPVTPVKTVSKAYTAFLSIAYHLQIKQASEVILLPVVKLAKLLGVHIRTISFYRKIAESQGLLEPVGAYSYAEKRASQFFFNVRLFDSHSLMQMGHCNQDKQEYQDKQDFQDNQDKHDNKDIQELKPKAKIEQISIKPQNSSYIPSESELESKKRQAFEVGKRFSREGVQ